MKLCDATRSSLTKIGEDQTTTFNIGDERYVSTKCKQYLELNPRIQVFNFN